jgi:hypothetical protein
VVLSAPLALGSVLGAPLATSLAAVVAAWAARRAGHDRSAGVLAGVAVALDHRALLAVPFVAFGGSRPGVARAVVSAAAAYLALVAPVALLDLPAFAARASAVVPAGPGLGLANLLAYRGAEGLATLLGPLSPILALGAMLWLLTRPWPGLARAALATLVGMILSPALGANAVVVPIVLLALAAMERGDEPEKRKAEVAHG